MTLESRSGPRPARRRLGRDPGRAADRAPGPPGGLEAGPGLPDPPADRPQVGPRAGRRPRPPRGDARLGPRPGRHGPPGRPGLHRLGAGRTSAWATRCNTLPRVIEAAKLTHAHHFIQDLPHGYDTVIGQLGHYLKPDEQFRIALARAYLHDPSILIVEEPNQPLDSNTQHFIDDTLARLSIGRTVIVIPHRLSSVRASDHVIVLHEGRVEDAGSPSHLQAESKLYRHLIYTEFNEYRDRRDRGRPMNNAEAMRKSGAAG